MGRVALWVGTILVAFGLGAAGAQKFVRPDHWQSLFTGWGYPAWFAAVVGVMEIGGALTLLVPKLAAYGAMLLAVIMVSALGTLLTHPGGPLGWGATPAVYVVLLAAIAKARWRERLGTRAS